MSSKSIQTALLGKSVLVQKPIQSLTPEEDQELMNAKREGRKWEWPTYSAIIQSVYLTDGQPTYTVSTESGELKNVPGEMVRVEVK
jgi:hypothetical protein